MQSTHAIIEAKEFYVLVHIHDKEKTNEKKTVYLVRPPALCAVKEILCMPFTRGYMFSKHKRVRHRTTAMSAVAISYNHLFSAHFMMKEQLPADFSMHFPHDIM